MYFFTLRTDKFSRSGPLFLRASCIASLAFDVILFCFVLFCCRGRRSKKKPLPEEDMCSRRDLHVDTRQVLGDRVVFPVVYNAYICTGKCDSPHKGHHQGLFTNHALVQYHMQVNNSANFICVPFSYSSLAVFQYVDQRKTHIVTRTFPEMIVSECKCAVVKEKFEN